MPIILLGLSANYDDSPRNAAVLFNVFLRLLRNYPFPSRGTKEDREFRSTWKLDHNEEDAAFVAGWMGKLMLFQDSATAKASPGLSQSDAEFLKLYGKDATWQPGLGGLSLPETKIQAAKLLWTAAFTPSEKFIPALLAAGSTNTRLAEIGDEILKANLPEVSLEEQSVITTLYSLLLGDEEQTGRPAAHPVLKGKILRLLCKSREAAAFPERIVALTKQELGASDPTSVSRVPYDKGLEASRLRKELFSFVVWVARMAPKQALEHLAPAVVADLRSYIENQGWPTIQDNSSMSGAQELVSRQRGYESIGLLAKACPQRLLLEPSLELLYWLFRSLVGDVSDKETTLCIETTLAILMHAFGSSTNAELEHPLSELLLHYSQLIVGESDRFGTQVRRSPRFIAVRFANRCFPFDNLQARWVDLVALSTGPNERQELVEEGTRGLDPYWFQALNPSESTGRSIDETEAYTARQYRIPDPASAIEFFFGSETKRIALRHAFVKAITFCRNALFHRALAAHDLEPVLNQDWERSLDALALLDRKGRQAIAHYLDDNSGGRGSALFQFCDSAFEGFLDIQAANHTDAGAALREILSLGPIGLRKALAYRAEELTIRIYGSDSISRSEASQIFALLASSESLNTDKQNALIADLIQKVRSWSSAVGGGVHQVCGALLSLTNLLCRLNPSSAPLAALDEMQAESLDLTLAVLFNARDQDLIHTALSSLDQLCIHGLLTEKTLPEKITFEKLLEKLFDFAKSGKEVAVLCLGHLAMQCYEGDTADGSAWTVFEKLESLHEVRQPELHFIVGTALSCLAAGWSSHALIRYRDIKQPQPEAAPRSRLLQKVISKVLEDCAQTKPALRQASAVWLLCLFQDCGEQQEIQDRLKAIHTCFRNLLSDRNSLNQETASRGLAIVYEKGNREMKDELIKDLVRSFTSNKSNMAGTVSEETELFDAGALPTGDGSVTTYKDIVDLATEVGDPSLVYKFMAMASSSAIWSSRAAFGRFGLSKVLADASESGYLTQNPKLYSTLYRYKFDPNTSVRSSMNEIWASLVSNPQSILDTHFETILEDLLKNILGKEWRTRQACCAAIADLVQTKPLSRYEQHLTDIWNAAFKVCDDIKGSVRKAAMELVRALTGILTRNLEQGDASTNSRMLVQVIPFLCGPQGLESGASDIRVFALSAILDIIKKGNRKTLQPYLGEMVASHLLPAFTSIEPDVINYAYMKPDNFNLTTEQIDHSRLNSVKLSPMMEAIERCLDMLDETSTKDLTQRLAECMKALIGVPSKIGASRIVVTLSTKHNVLFRPHSDRFLKLLRRQVTDRNETVSTSAAAACGYLVRVVSDGAALDHIKQVKSLYFQASEERARFAAADLTCAMVKYATDRAHSFAAELLPFVFLAMHDTDGSTSGEFKAAWEEMAGGSRTVHLYLKEIAELTAAHIESAQWAFKHASSLAIADAINILSPKISDGDARALWPSLDKALSAKTWKGKEKVLQAFVTFVKGAQLVKQEAAVGDRCKVPYSHSST